MDIDSRLVEFMKNNPGFGKSDTPSPGEMKALADFIKENPEALQRMEECMQGALGSAGLDDSCTLDDVMDHMRLSAPIRYDVFAAFLKYLKWDLRKLNLNAGYLEPFAFTHDKQRRRHPLYAVSVACQPGDDDDSAVAEILAEIEDKESSAVLFFKRPMVKTINGKCYACYGKCLKYGMWHDFLLSPRSAKVDAVLAQSESDIENPTSLYLEDEGHEFASEFSASLDGVDFNKGPVSMSLMEFPETGWGMFLPE